MVQKPICLLLLLSPFIFGQEFFGCCPLKEVQGSLMVDHIIGPYHSGPYHWWWIYVCADFKSASNDNGKAWMIMSSRVNNGDIIDNSTGEGNLAGVYHLVETNQPFPAVCSLY